MTAIIFDLDGTLIDSAPDIHAISVTVMQAEGMPTLSLEQVRGFIGNGVGVLISRCIAAAGVSETPELHKRMCDHVHALYPEQTDLTVMYPNVREILQDLRDAGHRIGLCTNKPEEATRAVLDHFNLTALFDAIACGDGPYPRKPDPAPLLHVTKALDSQAIYVGDSEVDAQTAQGARMPFLLFTEGYRKTPVDELPLDAAFDHFDQLPDLVRKHAPGKTG